MVIFVHLHITSNDKRIRSINKKLLRAHFCTLFEGNTDRETILLTELKLST